MPNWCNNSIAFYQEDGGNDLLEAFYTDIERYQNFTNVNGSLSNWCGHYLISNKIDTDEVYCRGFFTNCELYSDHVRIDMETAWGSLPEIYEKFAEKYGLSFVYIAEESGCEIYVNTDIEGRFFTDRYILDYFEVEGLELDAETMTEYGARLKTLAENTHYCESFEDVMKSFKDFGFFADNIESLNKHLEQFNITVHEYTSE
ncbi:MAG: hypothetical protein FWE74_08770 [Oscillospiraceae bacterium]|nr:hypothetical protein [Oscillospiraceae bacterium]